MSVGENIYSQALSLPPLERERLAVRILTSLELPSVEADRAWLAELERRSEAFERGDCEDMAKLRAQFPEQPTR